MDLLKEPREQEIRIWDLEKGVIHFTGRLTSSVLNGGLSQ